MKQLILGVLAMLLAAGCDAHGVGGIADMAVIDRASGAALPIHSYRGEYWVAGQPGARYAIEIRNRSGERLLAVTSVDGVNVLSGATASWDQAGYVFGPAQGYQITGWRKSDTIVAAFTFTDSPNSYAERTGRPANVGVIGVALFRERQALPEIRRYEAAAAPSKEPRAEFFSAPKLGTGHGEREYSSVSHTEFVRQQSQPNEIIRIHYDSLDNLLARGILRRQWQPMPDPFPASPQYVPDPPG